MHSGCAEPLLQSELPTLVKLKLLLLLPGRFATSRDVVLLQSSSVYDGELMLSCPLVFHRSVELVESTDP
jgi:hypothetical protein